MLIRHFAIRTGTTACGKTYEIGRKNLRRTSDPAQVTCSACLKAIPHAWEDMFDELRRA